MANKKIGQRRKVTTMSTTKWLTVRVALHNEQGADVNDTEAFEELRLGMYERFNEQPLEMSDGSMWGVFSVQLAE